jgi:polar amino acid transport system ATP-binding protein
MTMLMVTHEMNFARQVADKLIFMHGGRIHEAGDAEQLFADPQTPELRQFISSRVI